MNVIRSYKRKRIPLAMTSGSVVLAHAAGACFTRLARARHGFRRAVPARRVTQ